MGSSAFPSDWIEAFFLATWQRQGHVVFIALRHEDQELPFVLCWGLRRDVASKRHTRSSLKLDHQSDALTALLSGRVVNRLVFLAKNRVKVELSDGGFLFIQCAPSGISIQAGPLESVAREER